MNTPRSFELKADDSPPLILDNIQLPSKILLRSKSYMTNLYIKRALPIREIARQMNVSHSTVIECLRRLGIHDKGSRKRSSTHGQIPFGYDYKNGKFDKNKEEPEENQVETLSEKKSKQTWARLIKKVFEIDPT